MILLMWACLALAWPNAFGIYYRGIKEVFQPPTSRYLRHDSYFGYSITYDEYNKRLVISAPRENNIGEVYNCDIENLNCTPIVKNVPRVSGNYTHDYWFGATVKSGRDFIMMCAPRYTQRSAIFRGWDDNEYATYGKCYSYANGVLNVKRPIREEERRQGNSIENTMDSFGWSIDVADDDSVIIGGPGMWHGRAMFYERPKIYQLPKLLEVRGNHVPEFNFGYAVASGTFINTHLMYAVGSPYGTSGFGEVVFYKGVKFVRTLKMDTPHLGSMFGAVLCAAKLSGKRTDLLVGAPTYATRKNYNLGAVYIYLAFRINDVPVFTRRIVGQVSGSMFGSSIISVGDLNDDERHEIAIGAPFEKNGHGVVYLYSGADLISKEFTEMSLKYLQRIEPEASYGESFGMSLTPLLDYDGNGCNEIAIGSPFTNTVVLLKCMAAVLVKTSAKFPNLQDRTGTKNKTNFEFEVCLSAKYPRLPNKITALVSTMVEMDHDYAKLADTNGTGRFLFYTSLNDKKPVYCKNVSFILPLDGKYETKISYTISSKLLNDPRTHVHFNESRVILNDRSILTIQDTLWAAECAGNTSCVPNLKLSNNFSFHREDDPYVIGSSIKETMNFTVLNYGEVAYDSCLRVRIDGANVIKTSRECVYMDPTDENTLQCESPMPLHPNTLWTTGQIELEMTHLTNLDKTVNVTVLLFNHCHDNFTKEIKINIPVRADPNGIVTKGETDIGANVNVTKEDFEQNGLKMQHVYTIANKGPTNWKELPVQVTLQIQPYIKYDDTPVTVYFSRSNFYSTCSFVSQNETAMTFLCLVESLTTMVEFAKILIPMFIEPGTLGEILYKNKNLTITSFVQLQLLDDYYKTKSITTVVTLLEAEIPTEPIIISVIIGLCIFTLIALILYLMGFFHRKKRQELKKLKIYVKNQAIARSSSMKSPVPAADQMHVQNMQERAGHKNTQAST